MKDYYSVLGISKTATEDEVRFAYLERARSHHFDSYEKVEDSEKSWAIASAYTTLSHPERRKSYDADLADEQSSSEESFNVLRFRDRHERNFYELLGVKPSTLYDAEMCSEAIELTMAKTRKRLHIKSTDIAVPWGTDFVQIKTMMDAFPEYNLDLVGGIPPHIGLRLVSQVKGYWDFRLRRAILHRLSLIPIWMGAGGVITVLIYALSGVSLRDDGIVPALWTMGLSICFPGWWLLQAGYFLLTRKVPHRNHSFWE